MTKLRKAVLLIAGIVTIAMDEITKAYLEAEHAVNKQDKVNQINNYQKGANNDR